MTTTLTINEQLVHAAALLLEHARIANLDEFACTVDRDLQAKVEGALDALGRDRWTDCDDDMHHAAAAEGMACLQYQTCGEYLVNAAGYATHLEIVADILRRQSEGLDWPYIGQLERHGHDIEKALTQMQEAADFLGKIACEIRIAAAEYDDGM